MYYLLRFPHENYMYPQFFVGGFMPYVCHLCLLGIVVSNTS